ncbi:hypothetical protein P186_0905 [Pyrobaculum ferrireducens]|uniref:Uncharacterized protein n=1 Tax=Pyrobaculum ferrireducens TaxID=1104324 RepID=G7VB36_9CREN|nr:hypothetical protein P186_0905 [Pyrobaculum ferrireducens]
MGVKKTEAASAADAGVREVYLKKLEEIKRAVEEGRVVRISGILVRKLEYKTTRRGGIIVIVNDGELIDYASKLLNNRRIEIL